LHWIVTFPGTHVVRRPGGPSGDARGSRT
jgi:hypothetical protein